MYLQMGNNQSMKKINFEDMQTIIKNPESYLIINTLTESEQHCLIMNTVSANDEETIVNKYMVKNRNIMIIIYGKNCNDDNVTKKSQQLSSLGFYNICVYLGGMFEWLMLQDIYGQDLFPTTGKEYDILKYKPNKLLGIGLLEY